MEPCMLVEFCSCCPCVMQIISLSGGSDLDGEILCVWCIMHMY